MQTKMQTDTIAKAQDASLSVPSSLRQHFHDFASQLRQAGCAAPELDARLLMCAVLGLSHADFIGASDLKIVREHLEEINTKIERRRKKEPVSRILGQREFYGLPFCITPDVLDPRPDTETLIDVILKKIKPAQNPLRILDLGTGSGAILLALLHHLPHATGVGTDISAAALEVSQKNAEKLGLAHRAKFCKIPFAPPAEEATRLQGVFNIIVSNPPYIATSSIKTLEKDVRRHDPQLALDGGVDGFAAYRDILSHIEAWLAPGACIVFEVGDGQAKSLTKLLKEKIKYRRMTVSIERDLAGVERCVFMV